MADPLTILALSGSLIFMGDSISVGIAPYIPATIKKNVIGASARQSWDGYPFPRDSTVILVLGSNDALEYGYSRQVQYENRIKSLTLSIASRTKQFVLVGPPCMTDAHIYLKDKAAKVTTENQREALNSLNLPNVKFLDMREVTLESDHKTCSRKYRAGDGVHFTGAGYQFLATWILESIKG